MACVSVPHAWLLATCSVKPGLGSAHVICTWCDIQLHAFNTSIVLVLAITQLQGSQISGFFNFRTFLG